MSRIVALASFALLTGFSCGGGEGVPCATSSSSSRAQCPGSPSTKRATAVQTLTAFQSSIRAEFSDAVWMGGIMGLYIGRDGKVGDTSASVLEPTGWTGNFCRTSGTVPMDSLNFDTTEGSCTVLRSCQAVNCGAVTPREFPKVDSDAAILAAFPSDADGVLYQVQYVGDVGNYWSITRLALNGQTAKSVNVNADTGLVQP